MHEKLTQLEVRISHLLRYGVLVSGGVIGIGWLAYLYHSFQSSQETGVFSQLATGHVISSLGAQSSLQSLYFGVSQFDPRSILSIGLIFLISLPILRVLLSLLIFWIYRDFVFVLFSGVVLSILIFGLLMGSSL